MTVTGAPCDAAFDLVDELVASLRAVSSPPAVWARLDDVNGDDTGIAFLGRRAVEVLAEGRGDPFAGFLEADEAVIEQYQWFKHSDHGADAIRLMAARCLMEMMPELCAG